MRRRDFLLAPVAVALPAAAQTRFQPAQDIAPLVADITHGATILPGGIQVSLPAIAENGNSVPLAIKVPGSMSASDRVTAFYVIAERNPRPLVATLRLGPAAGRAEVSTRIRLAGTQKLTVLAALADTRFRRVDVEVVVTSAACLDESL